MLCSPMHGKLWFNILKHLTVKSTTNIQIPKCYYTINQQKSISFKQYLHSKISTTGPISVAEFMKSALTNPHSGYYMHKDVFGPKGDFVTSPELSQMLGELIAIWILNEWKACNKPSTFQIVELGPGKGTLCEDILRTFKQLKHSLEGSQFSLHLVEVSPTLSQIQHQKLTSSSNEHHSSKNGANTYYMAGCSSCNVPVYWYKCLDDVSEGQCSFFIAHEFLDALPVHKFVKTNDKWKEMYVDIDRESTDLNFRFVMMKNPTPASKMLIQESENRNHVEISPESAVICQKIASKISSSHGAALLADYGHFGTKEDTLRGFKQHTLVDVLSDVGECDVTADVDFKYIYDNLRDYEVDLTGPITQQMFLRNMGIDVRLMMLLRSTADGELRRKLIGSYDVITNPNKMGERFKFFAMTSKSRNRSGEFANVTGFA